MASAFQLPGVQVFLHHVAGATEAKTRNPRPPFRTSGALADYPMRNSSRSAARAAIPPQLRSMELINNSGNGRVMDALLSSPFRCGSTVAMKGESAGIKDFEVVAFLVVLRNQFQ